MAATTNLSDYAAAAAVTCTLPALATGSARESDVVDNTGDLMLDYLVQVTFTLASGSPTTNGPYVNIYASGTGDGTLWPLVQLATGAPFTTGAGDASVGALGTPANLALLGAYGLQTTTTSGERTFRTQPFSVAQAFGGVVPSKFSIIVENLTGVAFSTSTATTTNYVSAQGFATTSGN